MAYHGLDTYLTDHLAGATAGVNLAEMAADGAPAATSTAQFFGQIAIGDQGGLRDAREV